MQVTVKSFDDKEVTIDYNHPLAGKDLLFDVTITMLRDATLEEIETGVVGGYANCFSGG
jgi:FKBP-type peptidyl-prolyl cis-trans isomerase SlyD